MKNPKRELKFYTPEEERELRKILESSLKGEIDVKEYVKKYAEVYKRTPTQLLNKLRSLATKQESKFTHQQETILKHCLFRGDDKKHIVEKYSKEWGIKKQAIAVKLNWLVGNITKSATEEQEQGMLFEGVPTKVVLFSDHFRVYF